MTTFDRFDPFDRRITEAIDEIAAARRPDYLNDILRQTARTSQRARWTFPERWFNVDTTLARPMLFGRRVPIRSLLVLVVLAALLATAAFYVGTQKRLPAPLGPAANGQIVFGIGGDLYVRDSPTGQARLLLGGPTIQGGAVLSPDGQLIAYDNVERGVDHAWVANIDGSNPRQILDTAFTGLTAQWSFDSRSMVLTTDVSGPKLWIAPADGSGAREIMLEGFWPLDAAWDPQRPGVLLVRAERKFETGVDLYYVDVSAEPKVLSKIEMGGDLVYGPDWEFRGLAFSPDGSTIAYNVVGREAKGEHFWLYLRDRDGSNERQVPLPAGVPALYSQAWAVFSPDGKWIAMESWISQPGGSTVNQIALATTDGSAPTRLVGPSVLGRSMVKIWSPDGTKILAHVDTLDDVYLIDPVSGEAELLPWKSDFPNWQRVAR